MELQYESLDDVGVVERHRRLAASLGIATGDRRVVDLGCGDGATLGELLARAGRGAVVVGIDVVTEALSAAADRLEGERRAGRLELLGANLDQTLPLASGTVDRALCHNVLECLRDPDGFLEEVHRVLRPGGSLLLSHPDYDTMVFTAPDLELTRRLVHAYCDTQQDWMEAVNGTIGRWLHDIAVRSPFTVDPLTATVTLSRGWRPRMLGHEMARHVATVLRRAGAARERDLDRWLEGLAAVGARGEFMWSVMDFAVVCRKDPVVL